MSTARASVRVVPVAICVALFFCLATSSASAQTVLPRAANELQFRYAAFDPLVNAPVPPANVRAKGGNQIYVVQLRGTPLETDREAMRQAGATIYNYVAHHAYLVKVDESVRAKLAQLPRVRAVLPYETAFKLDETLVDAVTTDEKTLPKQRYNIQVFERGLAQQQAVGERIRALGGTVHYTNPNGFRMEATLPTEETLVAIARRLRRGSRRIHRHWGTR